MLFLLYEQNQIVDCTIDRIQAVHAYSLRNTRLMTYFPGLVFGERLDFKSNPSFYHEHFIPFFLNDSHLRFRTEMANENDLLYSQSWTAASSPSLSLNSLRIPSELEGSMLVSFFFPDFFALAILGYMLFVKQ